VPQEQGVLGVRICQRWSQGTLAYYFQNSPPLMALLSIKINTNYIPRYLASIRQVPARFHEKNNNLGISEKWNVCASRFFIL
jgi:hypothetical protein